MDLYRVINRPEDSKDIKSVASQVNEELEKLASTLQRMALEESKRCKKKGRCNCGNAYLDAIGEINSRFQTNYSITLREIEEHFNKPAKDIFARFEYKKQKKKE